MKTILILILTIFSVTIQASVDPIVAYDQVKKDQAVLIDVREEDEIKQGMINKAKWFALSRIKTDKKWKEDFLGITQGKKIFLYCRSGNRSQQVLNILKDENIKSENLGGYEDLKKVLGQN